MHLAKCLTEELANQAAQQVSRSYSKRTSVSPEPEPRARSYDHDGQKDKGWFVGGFLIVDCM